MPVHLGGHILRAETASLAAVTLAQYLWSDLA
jgi:16S rRNA U1498 N3-methylase RsmE